MEKGDAISLKNNLIDEIDSLAYNYRTVIPSIRSMQRMSLSDLMELRKVVYDNLIKSGKLDLEELDMEMKAEPEFGQGLFTDEELKNFMEAVSERWKDK